MNDASLELDPQVQRLLGEASAWRLAALLFERPRDGWTAEVAGLAAEVSDPLLREAATAAADETDASLYDTTFGPGGPAAPREISYRPTVLTGGFLSELRAFYEAFAYEPAVDEPPDHVAVEAGFVAYLRLKEAYALSIGAADQAAVTAAAAADFLREHLALIATPLAAALQSSAIPYLTHAATALAHRAGPPPSQPDAPLPLPLVDDTCDFGCSLDAEPVD